MSKEKLTLKWDKRSNDFVVRYPQNRCDGHLILNAIMRDRLLHDNSGYRKAPYNFRVENLSTRLEEQGYDLTTLQFSIEKADGKKSLDGFVAEKGWETDIETRGDLHQWAKSKDGRRLKLGIVMDYSKTGVDYQMMPERHHKPVSAEWQRAIQLVEDMENEIAAVKERYRGMALGGGV